MRNWAGNVEYRARARHEPTSIDEVAAIVRAARRLRVLGTGHSFNDLADTTGDHLSLAGLAGEISIDPAGRTVEVGGGVRYGELCRALHAEGLALANLASLPHISVAGACATATHGSGVGVGNLATAVAAIELVRADGELLRLTRAGEPDAFPGAVVALGALGVVTRLTLDVEPAYDVRQDVFEGLSFETFDEHAEEVAGTAYSVSLFTDWASPTFHQVWLKSRVEPGADLQEGPAEWFGARRATRDLHPIRGFPADACTPQLGRVGPWHARLPHFRLDHTPSAGDELQTEYFVARRDAPAAVRAIATMAPEVAALVQVTEVRTIAADGLWLSPTYGRDSTSIHFTWRPDQPAVLAMLPRIEAALAPFGPRPHWGKLFTLEPSALRASYERLPDFLALAERLDPEGTFRNAFLDRWVFG